MGRNFDKVIEIGKNIYLPDGRVGIVKSIIKTDVVVTVDEQDIAVSLQEQNLLTEAEFYETQSDGILA